MRGAGAVRPLVMIAFAAIGLSDRATYAQEPTPPPPPNIEALEHAETVTSYTLNARLDPIAHTVHGSGTIQFRNVSSKPVSELWMHLYLNAFKNQSSAFIRAPIGGFRGSSTPRSWGFIDVKKISIGGENLTLETHRPNDEDETDARVVLPFPLGSGNSLPIDIEWDATLPSVVERTGFDGSFHMIAQWFPKLARLEQDGTWAHFPFHHLGEFYADFGTYDVTLDVPQGFAIGATGPIKEQREENGRHIERHVQTDIHDFAWTAWDKWVTRSELIEGVNVTVMTPPHYDDHMERELETMRFALPHYNARYGKYPYEVLTVVHPPEGATEAGGMEYPTLITTGSVALMPRGIHLLEAVTIHEFGHQWFYGMCASNEDSWPFLDEGVNQYAEGEAMAAWKGAGSGVDILGIRVGDHEWQADRSRFWAHDERVAQGAGEFASGSAYGALVYSRTAALLATLGRVYGKQKLDRALAVYTRRFRFKHPTPDDLIEVVRAEIEPGAAANLRRALFEKGWVDYAVTQMSSHPARAAAGVFDRGGRRETTKPEAEKGRYAGWALVVRRGNLSFPVEIEFTAEDGTKSRVPWDGDAESFRAPYSGASPLVSVVVDPDDRVMVDQRMDNNHRSTFGHSNGASRVLERATYWAEMIMGALGP